MARGKEKLTAVGITCGVGSMLIGAKQAGFKVLGNVEWRGYYHKKDEEGRNTFKEYFGKGATFTKRIEDLAMDEFERMQNPTLVMSHPECGNFSNMRVDKTGALNDPGDIPLAMELIGKIRPRFFAMDDLPKSFIAYSMEEYVNALPDYDLFPEWVSNYNYGNVQKNRKRFFMIGALKSEKFTFVPGEEPNAVTVEDLLIDLLGHEGEFPNTEPHVCGKENCGKAKDMYGYGNRYTWADVKKYFKEKKCGEGMTYDSSSGIRKSRFGFYKEYWDKHAHVLHGGDPIIHPLRNLPLNIRERARIQGAPDDFIFYGTRLDSKGRWNVEKNNDMVKQVGKFMPVQFCRYVSKQVAAHVDGKKFNPSGRRFLVNNPYIDDAKMWYCENVGYTDQKSACSACWQHQECDAKRKVKL